ncbi:MAG: protein kinase [Deltaproteobacteria bacterium]|nr:protein kinase [Deltaproteobacteria bacterium]
MLTLDEVRPGLALGRYECLLPIARGGMAAVWAARAKGARGFQRFVAIKTMLPTLSSDANFETMFLDEARIVARIRHPNVVEVVDLGEKDSLLYIVMEWIDGEPLSTLMRKASTDGRLPLGIAARIMSDACAGLHAAHELKDDDGKIAGLVHRDFSPQNVLISYDGLVKLVDFGVAKAAGVSSAETAAGHIKGKLAYMAPEQVTGERVDRRTDIFACGIVLYQITTGKHPFRGAHDAETINNALSRDVPSPKHYIPDCPPRLHQVLMRSLQRDPAKRFQTASEMAHELDELARKDGRRVTVETVGAFATEVAGAIGEERRAALKKAVAEVDAHSEATVVGPFSPTSAAQPEAPSPIADIFHDLNLPAAVAAPDTGQSAVAVPGDRTPTTDTSGQRALPEPRASRAPWIIAAVVLCVAAAALIVSLRGGKTQEPLRSASSAPPPASASQSGSPVVPASTAASASAAPESSAAPAASATASAAASAGGKRVPGKSPGKSTPGGWVPPLSDPGF